MHLTALITDYLPKLEHLGVWVYWIALAVALMESLAFIGTIIPGSTTIVFMGFLAAQGYWDIGDLIWFTSIGAVLGDIFSYWLGTKGIRFFKNENRWLKESHLDKGKAFFEKHGNKSVFLGRFVAPIRAIVPFVAGLSHMNKRAFLFWNILSGLIWSMLHLYLGYFFGNAAKRIEIWTSRAGIIVAVLLTLGFLFYWRRRKGEL